MLKELTEYSNNIKEDTKITLSDIKKNLQGTNSGGDEAEIQTNDLGHEEGKSIQTEQQEEKKKSKDSKKWEDRLRNLWNNFNIQIIGVPEGEEEEQEIENLFEKITKKTSPIWRRK